MDRLTTGNTELDAILHGGLPTGGLVVLSGPPGSGKTVLALQIAFANATDEHPAYYYSTLSESHTKLRQHLASLDYYDDDAIDGRVRLVQLSEYASQAEKQNKGLAVVVDELLTRAFSDQPAVIIVDSSKALQLYSDPDDVRATTFDLASKISHTGAVLIFVGEYGRTDPDTAPEFAVADTILELANDADLTTDRRTIRVAKIRGSSFIAGQHPIRITNNGVDVDARLETVAQPPTAIHHGRATLGHDELDAMAGGGIPRGDVSLLMGPSGAGKTTLAMQFIDAGLRAGETALFITLEESPTELTAKADRFGLDFTTHLEQGQLHFLHGRAGITDLDDLGHQLRTHIEVHRPDRIALDALSTLSPHIMRAQRSPAFESALTETLRSRGATSMVSFEIQALANTTDNVAHMSNLANNVLLLRYMERGSELGRVLSILKMRRSNHDKGLLQYDIGKGGLTPLGEAGNVRQITGWNVVTSSP